jgi:amino acid transporter
LSWREGLFLVGPDPLTSLFYSSGALIVAGVGYATPAFQIGLYLLLFLLAPLYIEAVLLTLSNGGTYVMTRYSLSHWGKLAVAAAAVVGVVISFSYIATAVVSLLSFSDYVMSLTHGFESGQTLWAIVLSTIPAIGFGVWVMPSQWRTIVGTVTATTLVAMLLSTVIESRGAVVMFAPLVVLFTLNNQGLKESVQVSKTIFLINIVVMAITIVAGVIYVAMNGVPVDRFVDGAQLPAHLPVAEHGHGVTGSLPGFAGLAAPLILAGTGASILGASGVESVMNIPEELERPNVDVRRIYRWMLTILLVVGGSVSVLLFSVLPPEELATKASYLVAAMGATVMAGLTGSERFGEIWQVVIVANAAFMLIGACNTGFAGARGLWLTMARDSLLPRAVLRPNLNGAFHRIHWLMLVAIFLLASEAEWNLPKLERWYGATFGLVMFSGMVAFILLRRFRGDDPRAYVAPFNVPVMGMRVPIGAIIGLFVLGDALLSMYSAYRGDIGELRTLVTLVVLIIAGVLLVYNHRPLIRAANAYFHRVIETVESTEIETEDRTVVVAVGDVRTGRLIEHAVSLARRQSLASGIAYRNIVVFHMTEDVKTEHVYRVETDSVRPSGVSGGSIRIFTEMTERIPSDLKAYLALVPPSDDDESEQITSVSGKRLHRALVSLVRFHDSHAFKGHMVMVGTYGVAGSEFQSLQDRLEGSTLVPVPLFGT